MSNATWEIYANTFLALAAGLFTGGVVTSIVSSDYSKEILLELYLPAIVFYYMYVACITYREGKFSLKHLIITFCVFILFMLKLLIY